MLAERRSILAMCAVLAISGACNDQISSNEPPVLGAGTAGKGNGGAGAGGAAAASGGVGGSAVAGSSGGTGGANQPDGSAGSSGSSSGFDSGAAGGPVACKSPNVCDDFEAYVFGKGFGPWQQNGTSGTLSIDRTHVFSGQQAVFFEVQAGANQRVQLQRKGAPLFPASNNAFWGRVMVWAHNLPGKSDTENKNVHYDVIQASGATPGEYRIAGMGSVLLNYEPHDCYYGTNKIIPEDRWACWEWLYDGTNDVIEFYIDGQLQARVASKGQGCVDGTDSVWVAPVFDELRIGFVNYQSKPEPTELWMDDFAAGPSRIGCPASSSRAH